MDLAGKAASPRDARRVRRLWALPPLLLDAYDRILADLPPGRDP